MHRDKEQFTVELHEKLLKVHDKFQKIQSRQMFDEKLTAPQFEVLAVLSKSGTIPLKSISKELLVTGANITCIIDNLEKEGFVKRINSKEDRRVIFAELTSSGRVKVESILPKYYEKINSLFDVLNDREQKDLMKILGKLQT